MPSPPQQTALTRYLRQVGETPGRRALRFTRLLETNDQLRQAKDELMEAHRAKSAFLASLSHQLRTPLNTILLCSELLTDDLTEQGLAAMTGDLGRIRTAGRHLLALLDDIIDLTRMEAGRMVFQQENTDLHALARKLTDSLRPLALETGNALELTLAIALQSLSTDPGRLEQILFHLLDNALKFTQGGTVTLAVRPIERGQAVLFSVQDNGRGMSAEQVERIRLDFAQTAESHRQTYGAAGLGLTVCRRLAEGLGGTLQVQSQMGSGSTFSLRLPRAKA